MEKVLVVDPDKCTGCKVCEMICSLHHENEINPTTAPGLPAIVYNRAI